MSNIKVLFITNILSRHQVGLWDYFYNSDDINFVYLCTKNAQDCESRYYVDHRKYVNYSANIDDDDITKYLSSFNFIIVGSVEDKRVKVFLESRNYFAYAYEHVSKYNFYEIKKLRGFRKYINFIKHRKTRFQPHCLKECILFALSSHASFDFRLSGMPRKNIYKFGYFPHYRYATDDEIKSKDPYSILWAGRGLSWKHPEIAISIYRKLSKIDSRFHLDLYGDDIKINIQKNEKIVIHDSISPNELASKLIETKYYCFTSDRREGWGAILGEALSAGCVVIANKQAGSTKFLCKKNISSICYKSKTIMLIKLPHLIKKDWIKKQIEAVNRMKTIWSGKTASDRLNIFIKSLNNKQKFKRYKDGPLS